MRLSAFIFLDLFLFNLLALGSPQPRPHPLPMAAENAIDSTGGGSTDPSTALQRRGPGPRVGYAVAWSEKEVYDCSIYMSGPNTYLLEGCQIPIPVPSGFEVIFVPLSKDVTNSKSMLRAAMKAVITSLRVGNIRTCTDFVNNKNLGSDYQMEFEMVQGVLTGYAGGQSSPLCAR